MKDKLPSKKDFQAYERVRRGGRWNMIVNARDAAADAHLGFDRYMAVLRNYELLMKKYPEVLRGET